MIRSKWAPLLAAALLSGSVLALADDTTQPSEEHHTTMRKLTKPYSELTDLSDAEKAQIASIHAKTLEQQRTILAKEKEEIMAVLTDDQKKELHAIEAKANAARKAKGAGSPTTEPDME